MATNTLQIPDDDWSPTASSPSPSSSRHTRPASTVVTSQSSTPPISSSGRKRASHSVSSPQKDEREQGKENVPYRDVYSHPAAVAFAAAHPRRTIPKFGPYLLLQTLGEGEFGKVKLGLHGQWGEEVAVKLIRRGNVDNPLRLSKVEREIEVLKVLKHPNIVRLYDVIETDKYIGIILEYASGGELFDHILAHRYLKEKDACKLFAQLISGVSYIHSKKIVHRDLKLENLLLDRSRNVIITDFGFANRFEHRADDLMQTSCGSPCYAAPELVISEGLYVGSAVDIWSCGVILYAMLAGYLPFDDDPANPEGDNINLLYKYIVNTPLTFPDYISPEARDLLSQMLVPDPKHRASLDEIKKHRWLDSYRHLFERSTAELERIAVEQQNSKRQAYQRQMRAAAQQANQTKEYLYDSSVANATTPRRGVASAIVLGSNHETESFIDSPSQNDALAPGSTTSEHERGSTRSKRSKSKEKRSKTPDKETGSRRKKTNQRHTLQLEYAEDVPPAPSPQVPVPPPQRVPLQELAVDVSASSGSSTDISQPPVQVEDEPSTPKAKTVALESFDQASPKTPTAKSPMPSSFEAIFTPPSQRQQIADLNFNQPPPSKDSVAESPQPSPQTTPRKAKGGDAASTNSGGSSSKRHRRGLSMDKFGFGIGKKASGGVVPAATGSSEILRNGTPVQEKLSSSTSALITKDSVGVNGNDTKKEKDSESEKDEKKSKNRRKTLSLMVEPLSRTIKERKNRSVTVETNKPRDNTKEEKEKKNGERPPTLTLTPISPGGGVARHEIPIDNIPEAPLSPPPGGIHNPTLPRALFNGPSSNTGASTLSAKGVMNWFRLRSLGKKEPEIMGEGHGGAADFVMVSPPPPSNVAASSASTTSRRTPSETSSATPSATSRITSIMRTVTSPRFPQVTSPFVNANTGPTSGTTTIASTLRIHHGAVDQGTVTNGAPTVVFAHVTEVLQGMGLEMQREAEFKWRCVRSKREKLSGFDVMVGSGTAGSGGVRDDDSDNVDKRGLPIPSHIHSSAGGMLRGLLMRRTTSQSSSNPSSSRHQTNSATGLNGNTSYDGEGDSSLLSDISMSMATTTTITSPDSTSPTSPTLYGDRSVDQGDEVRFSVELTRLDRLEDTLSLDIRRLKGNLRSYKFLYDTLRDRCAFVQ
ncbi:hypothetical protein Clacol_003384 [Clathrus columnatus]|uniref:Non-specific serine/threonine protein kinase n=1 Tax=Clathrus columnatus TaxID=1419009 RepID=A0AAV5A6M9_9AGAM|nr:hypothetical protein Clacol_003384 [Clathrus columnatus]